MDDLWQGAAAKDTGASIVELVMAVGHIRLTDVIQHELMCLTQFKGRDTAMH